MYIIGTRIMKKLLIPLVAVQLAFWLCSIAYGMDTERTYKKQQKSIPTPKVKPKDDRQETNYTSLAQPTDSMQLTQVTTAPKLILPESIVDYIKKNIHNFPLNPSFVDAFAQVDPKTLTHVMSEFVVPLCIGEKQLTHSFSHLSKRIVFNTQGSQVAVIEHDKELSFFDVSEQDEHKVEPRDLEKDYTCVYIFPARIPL